MIWTTALLDDGHWAAKTVEVPVKVRRSENPARHGFTFGTLPGGLEILPNHAGWHSAYRGSDKFIMFHREFLKSYNDWRQMFGYLKVMEEYDPTMPAYGEDLANYTYLTEEGGEEASWNHGAKKLGDFNMLLGGDVVDQQPHLDPAPSGLDQLVHDQPSGLVIGPDKRLNLDALPGAANQVNAGEQRFVAALKNSLYTSPEVAYANAGMCMKQAGDVENAERYFRAALQRNPRMRAPLLNMAEVSLDREQALSARGYLQRYLELAPHSPRTLWLGIRIEQELGDKNAVASYAILLRSKFPDSDETGKLQAAGL